MRARARGLSLSVLEPSPVPPASRCSHRSATGACACKKRQMKARAAKCSNSETWMDIRELTSNFCFPNVFCLVSFDVDKKFWNFAFVLFLFCVYLNSLFKSLHIIYWRCEQFSIIWWLKTYYIKKYVVKVEFAACSHCAWPAQEVFKGLSIYICISHYEIPDVRNRVGVNCPVT